MELHTLATGSSGNCYILKDTEGKSIVLDCGIKFHDITHHKAFPKFKDIDFLFVSHSHHDHDRSLKDFKLTGCEIVSYETLNKKTEQFSIGNWECITFPVAHNVPNWGIIIRSKTTGERFCYVTDFTAIPKIEGIDYWLYEVNYIQGLVDKMIENDRDLSHLGFNNHNSLESAVEYFSSLNTRPKKIYCCHSSPSHSIRDIVNKHIKQFADEVIVL